MIINLGTPSKATGFFLVLIGSVLLAVLASSQNNEFWSSPLIALVIMFFLGHLPPAEKKGVFLWIYFVLILGSAGLLLFTPQQVYWTSPILLGVLLNVFEIEIKLGDE